MIITRKCPVCSSKIPAPVVGDSMVSCMNCGWEQEIIEEPSLSDAPRGLVFITGILSGFVLSLLALFIFKNQMVEYAIENDYVDRVVVRNALVARHGPIPVLESVGEDSADFEEVGPQSRAKEKPKPQKSSRASASQKDKPKAKPKEKKEERSEKYYMGQYDRCVIKGKTRCAISALRQGLKINPTSYFFSKNLILTLVEQGRYREATQVYERTVAHVKFDSIVMAAVAKAYAKRDDYENAITLYYKSLNTNPSQLQAAIELSRILVELGDFYEGLSMLGAYGQIYPEKEKRIKKILDTFQRDGFTTQLFEKARMRLPEVKGDFYVPVQIGENSDYHFFEVRGKRRYTTLNAKYYKRIKKDLRALGAEEEEVQVKMGNDFVMAKKIRVDSIKVGKFYLPDVTFYTCRKCKNVLGAPYATDLITEKQNQYGREFLFVRGNDYAY